jgi:aspartyl-tRNA(Asn)/glutamyl-tRNA(Gln) amidotransferase subunit A
VAPATSTAIARIQDAGAVCLGALHMAEFAYGPTGHNEHLGPARNPWDPQRITGGSSSGSAASVAARLTYAALGSDTGGSIRLPAHFCGVTGFKPTYGRVSRANAMPLSFTLDTVGPLALSAEDCALIGSVIAGADPLDPTTSGAPVWDMAATQRTPKGMTIGVPRKFYVDDLEFDVAALLDEALATFRRLGARVVEVDLPDQTAISAAALIVLAVEATSLHAPWLRERAGDYGVQVRNRLQNGLAYSAVEYLEALRWRGPRSQLISRRSRTSTSSSRLLRALRRRPSKRPM